MQQCKQNRREFLWSAAAMGAAAAATAGRARAAADDARPNIILIMADDFGYECVGANGGASYRTPVLDRLAAEGVRFEHCYAQPLCTPSRVKLMTGMSNARNYAGFGILGRAQTTFAHLLKARGYATCIAGKWQLGKAPDAPAHFGFDASCLWQHTRGRTDSEKHDTRYENPHLEINGKPVEYDNGEYGPDVASGFLCEFMEAHRDGPFFLYYPMILTHCPFVPTPDSEDWDPASPGSRRYKGAARYFEDMAAYTDKMVGKLVAKLEELGIRENTLLLFTGDNGTDEPVVSMLNGRRVPGGKGEMTDAGTRVPLIANWPAGIAPGRVLQDLADFSDFLPTICEAAGADIPGGLEIDGRSFLPQLKGEQGNPRDWIYCWYARSGKDEDVREFARNQQYKLYRSGEFYDIGKDVLEKQPIPEADPGEKQRAVRAMLQAALDRYRNVRPPALRK
jgi:arylsulfatase A